MGVTPLTALAISSQSRHNVKAHAYFVCIMTLVKRDIKMNPHPILHPSHAAVPMRLIMAAIDKCASNSALEKHEGHSCLLHYLKTAVSRFMDGSCTHITVIHALLNRIIHHLGAIGNWLPAISDGMVDGGLRSHTTPEAFRILSQRLNVSISLSSMTGPPYSIHTRWDPTKMEALSLDAWKRIQQGSMVMRLIRSKCDKDVASCVVEAMMATRRQ